MTSPEAQPNVNPGVTLPNGMSESIAANPETCKAYLDAMTDDEFKAWLLRINASVRGIQYEGHDFDGKGTIVGDLSLFSMPEATVPVYTPPEPADRLPLVLDAFHLSKKIDDPNVAGALLATSVNLSHIHADGNGRVGRTIYALLSKGYKGSEDDPYYAELLANEAGRSLSLDHAQLSSLLIDTYYADRKAAATSAYGYANPLPESSEEYPVCDPQFRFPPTNIFDPFYWVAEQGLNTKSETILKQVIDDPPYVFRDLAVFELLLETGRAEQFVRYSEEGDCYLIAYGDFLAALTDEDVLRLGELHRTIRRDFVSYAVQSIAEHGLPEPKPEEPGTVEQLDTTPAEASTVDDEQVTPSEMPETTCNQPEPDTEAQNAHIPHEEQGRPDGAWQKICRKFGNLTIRLINNPNA